MTHASNVTGCVQPVEEIARQAAALEVPLVIDASQSAGVIPLDYQRLPGRVYVAFAPSSLWNNFAGLITNSVQADLKPAAEALLVNAAHECGCHTGFGIITSEEWDAVCGPMIQSPEDVLHAAYAVFTVWGWGPNPKSWNWCHANAW